MSVPHDHPTVETVDGEVRTDRLDRPRVHVPADLPASVVRVVLDGRERFGRFRDADGGSVLRGLYDTPERARDPGGGDRLAPWLDDAGLAAGRTVHLDVVEPGYRYGLRAPGGTAVYETGRPPEGLADIARDLD